MYTVAALHAGHGGPVLPVFKACPPQRPPIQFDVWSSDGAAVSDISTTPRKAANPSRAATACTYANPLINIANFVSGVREAS